MISTPKARMLVDRRCVPETRRVRFRGRWEDTRGRSSLDQSGGPEAAETMILGSERTTSIRQKVVHLPLEGGEGADAGLGGGERKAARPGLTLK
jgi:hypothetical protein